MHLSPTFLTKNTNFTTYKNSRPLWKNMGGASSTTLTTTPNADNHKKYLISVIHIQKYA